MSTRRRSSPSLRPRCAAPTRESTVGGRFMKRSAERPARTVSRRRSGGLRAERLRAEPAAELVGEADAREAEAPRQVVEREQVEERDVADEVDHARRARPPAGRRAPRPRRRGSRGGAARRRGPRSTRAGGGRRGGACGRTL